MRRPILAQERSVAQIARVLGVVFAGIAAVLMSVAACAPFEPALRSSVDSRDAAPSQPVRRLSHSEYRATLRDLFPSVGLSGLALAPDERLRGFSNNYQATTASPLLVSQYQANALLVAESVGRQLPTLPCANGDRRQCAEDFVRGVAPRIYRRPLSESELRSLLAIFDKPEMNGKPYLAAQVALAALLQSPQFLYHFRSVGSDSVAAFERASRLSYFLWASTPDAQLFEAAARGQLEDADDVERETARMLADPKARYGISLIFTEWLKLDKIASVLKLPQDGFDKQFAADLQENAVQFAYDGVFSGDQNVSALLLSDKYPLSSRVDPLLSQTQSPSAPPRAGLLTHPAVLGAHAYARYPSPVLRGVFVLDRILCSPPSPPPRGAMTVVPEPEAFSASTTNRQRYVQATRGPGCFTCHKDINQLGFAFENYDTLGRYQVNDGGQAIDASGKAMGFRFRNAAELAHQISDSGRYQRCVSDTWLNYALGGSPDAQRASVREQVFLGMNQRDATFRGLIETIARHPAFLGTNPQ
jgi:Protein of unknown function (DUF1588)/Protein of unknown function (DUF1592)/Protein of unknown function (DUF1595)/Protein of unknown function (DUF1587)/Protein of unknown function (DUF1585)